jgi:hypothetical protein
MSEAESIEKLKAEVSAIESEIITYNFLTEKEKELVELIEPVTPAPVGPVISETPPPGSVVPVIPVIPVTPTSVGPVSPVTPVIPVTPITPVTTSEKDIDTEYTPDPVCPYCGFVDVDWYDGLDSKGDGDEWIAECPLCDKPYTCLIEIRTDFTTKRYEEEEEQSEEQNDINEGRIEE